MPELAEIKIMAEYINDVCRGHDFTGIGVSSAVSKRLPMVTPTDLQIFEIIATAKGKSLMLTLTSGATLHYISISMGMSGHWVFCKTEDRPKHTHLVFSVPPLLGGYSLCLVDARRFAKWKWGTWPESRGPCPVTEYPLFVENIKASLNKKTFDKPIHLVLMDQRYFNGIGNYLRAEIMYRANQDPFEEARTALTKNPKLLELCETVPFEAYLIGGGQLKDWKNPFNIPKNGFSDWIKCYGRSDRSLIDANGRKLWYFEKQSQWAYAMK